MPHNRFYSYHSVMWWICCRLFSTNVANRNSVYLVSQMKKPTLVIKTKKTSIQILLGFDWEYNSATITN